METTPYTKMYKAALLYSLYNNGRMRLSSTTDDIIESFKEFFTKDENRFDVQHLGPLEKVTRMKWVEKESQPRRHLSEDESGFFIDSKDMFSLNPSFGDVIWNSEFIQHFGDILDFRTEDYRRFRKR